MKLPLLLSVPHAGLDVPPEVAPYCLLTRDEIVADGDEGAAEIYDLETLVEAFQTTNVARAFVDMNRSEDDRRLDGVVKTHTCWNVPIYGEALPEEVIEALLDRYHRPYHDSLTALARGNRLRLAIDCHTMAATAPPVGPDPGKERPWICLSNAEGTCPRLWIETLRDCIGDMLDGPVTINDPFTGGHITRHHSNEMPWLQMELSRAPFLPNVAKRQLVHAALERWATRIEEP